MRNDGSYLKYYFEAKNKKGELRKALHKLIDLIEEYEDEIVATEAGSPTIGDVLGEVVGGLEAEFLRRERMKSYDLNLKFNFDYNNNEREVSMSNVFTDNFNRESILFELTLDKGNLREILDLVLKEGLFQELVKELDSFESEFLSEELIEW